MDECTYRQTDKKMNKIKTKRTNRDGKMEKLKGRWMNALTDRRTNVKKYTSDQFM